ncbi:hypothetical protein cypCar_00049350, partial [Cyprinus carpio]
YEMISIVIVDIKLLSGFTADTAMIPKNIPMNYQIQMKQVLPVKNLRPAVVKVYDYYQTSDQSENTPSTVNEAAELKLSSKFSLDKDV